MTTPVVHRAVAALLAALAVSSTPWAATAQTAPTQVAQAQAPGPLTELDRRFRAIADEEWVWRSTQATLRWDRTSAHLPDVSAENQARQLAYWSNVQQKLNAISPDQLSPGERTNYAVYKHDIDNKVDDIRYGLYEMPFTADSSFWSSMALAAN
ncbi:MAG: DUF885 domain-containing protein, partial [Brevundimonas sp.]